MSGLAAAGVTAVALAVWGAVTAAAAGDSRLASLPSPAAMQPHMENLGFDILRNGEPVGRHRVTFSRRSETLTVRAETEIALRFLFLTAYRFTYRSESSWRDGRLQSLTARTDDDGAVTTVSARRDGATLRIEGTGGAGRVSGPIYPTDHWHIGVVESRRVLNTITGAINAVSIVAHGLDVVATPSGDLSAWRYAYTGDLETEVWYDAIGRWVAMRFQARDGSTIRYVCRRCTPERDQAALP